MSPRNYNETPVYRVFAEYNPKQIKELYMTLCGIEQCRSDKERECRIRDGFHLHAVLSGYGTLEVGGQSTRLSEGQLFLIKPGEKIAYYPDKQSPWTYCWMSFDGVWAEGLMAQAGFTDGVYTRESHVPVSSFYRLCSAALDTPQPTRPAALRRLGMLFQFVATAIESNDFERGNGKQRRHRPLHNRQDYIRYAIDYIKNNYGNIRLTDVSDYLGINYNYFSAIFRQSQGISPNEYLLRVRMRQSSQMLASLTMDIQTIANYVGYSDSLTFSKAFKRFFGVSPKNYREMSPEQRPAFDHICINRTSKKQE